MGIKQKDENSAGGLHNALAAGTTIKGNIITETDFRLDGKVEGDISCNGKIVIGPKGSVTGNIVSENAEILGEVDGSVKVSAKLILKSTAIIKGDIFTVPRTMMILRSMLVHIRKRQLGPPYLLIPAMFLTPRRALRLLVVFWSMIQTPCASIVPVMEYSRGPSVR